MRALKILMLVVLSLSIITPILAEQNLMRDITGRQTWGYEEEKAAPADVWVQMAGLAGIGGNEVWLIPVFIIVLTLVIYLLFSTVAKLVTSGHGQEREHKIVFAVIGFAASLFIIFYVKALRMLIDIGGMSVWIAIIGGGVMLAILGVMGAYRFGAKAYGIGAGAKSLWQTSRKEWLTAEQEKRSTEAGERLLEVEQRALNQARAIAYKIRMENLATYSKLRHLKEMLTAGQLLDKSKPEFTAMLKELDASLTLERNSKAWTDRLRANEKGLATYTFREQFYNKDFLKEERAGQILNEAGKAHLLYKLHKIASLKQNKYLPHMQWDYAQQEKAFRWMDNFERDVEKRLIAKQQAIAKLQKATALLDEIKQSAVTHEANLRNNMRVGNVAGAIDAVDNLLGFEQKETQLTNYILEVEQIISNEDLKLLNEIRTMEGFEKRAEALLKDLVKTEVTAQKTTAIK